MPQSTTANESPALEKVRQQFDYWRRTREKRGPIPGELWQAAQSLYPEHSLLYISKTLRLNYTDLKQRIEQKVPASIPSPINPAEFIELKINAPMQPTACLVEMEDALGAKMKMHFKGSGCLDLLELSKIFWSRQP